MRSFVLPFLCILIAGLWPGSGRAQQFEAAVDYNHVAVGDTIKLVLVYTGNPDSISAYLKINLKDFTVAGGPFQTSTSNSVRKGAGMITTRKAIITYNLYMDKPGVFGIPAASIGTKDGKTHTTKVIPVTVDPPPFVKGKKLESPLLEDSRPEDFFKEHNFEAASTSYKASQQIKSVTAPFVLITGWGYLPDAVTQSQSDSIMAAVDTYMATRSDARELNRIVTKESARRYYTLRDTAGIVQALFPIYKAAGREAKAKVILTQPAAWSLTDERLAFDGDSRIWPAVYNILHELDGPGFDPEKKKMLLVAMTFNSIVDMNRFIAFAEKEGYKTSKEEREQAPGLDRYYVVCSRPVKMKEKELYAAIRLLTGETGKIKYKRAMMLGVSVKDPE